MVLASLKTFFILFIKDVFIILVLNLLRKYFLIQSGHLRSRGIFTENPSRKKKKSTVYKENKMKSTLPTVLVLGHVHLKKWKQEFEENDNLNFIFLKKKKKIALNELIFVIVIEIQWYICLYLPKSK